MNLGTLVVLPGKKLEIFIAFLGNETRKLLLPYLEKELDTFLVYFELKLEILIFLPGNETRVSLLYLEMKQETFVAFP